MTSSFVAGANLPWVSYGTDFGTNAWWPQGGLAHRSDLDRVREALAQLAAAGGRLVRWFVFCDGRAGIRFDGDNAPLGLDDRVFPDFERALALVEEAGLEAIFVLLDYTWCRKKTTFNGVQMRGRQEVLRRRHLRERLFEHVFAPLFERFGREPAIRAWDLINEPEWVTFTYGSWRPLRSVGRWELREYLASAARLVHELTSQQVTVGSAAGHWLDLVRDCGLDFYQVHWYDRLDRQCHIDRPVAELGVDRPVWLGEFPTRNSARRTYDLLTLARRRGYAGALYWSLLAPDGSSDNIAASPELMAWHRDSLEPPGEVRG